MKYSLPTNQKSAKISQLALLPPENLSNCCQLSCTTESEENNNRQRFHSQVYSLLPVYLLQLCYGMNSAFPAIITPQLTEQCSEFRISITEESWIVSLDNLLSPLICISSGFLQQKVGPLRMLMFCCIPYSAGWMVAAMARDAYHLYISRILVSISHAIITTTVYTIEITSKELRGSLSVLESVIRCVGSVLVYSLGFSFRWWEIASLASLVPITAFLSCMFVPESPVFLVKKGKLEEAEQSVARTFGPDHDNRMEVRIISDNLKQLRETKTRKSDYIRSIKDHPEVYKPLLIIVFLSLVQQFSGVSVIRAYVVKIFDEVFSDYNHQYSVEDHNKSMIVTQCTPESQTSGMAYTSAILIGVCRLISSVTLARLLKIYPRRSMYFLSSILTVLCIIIFSIISYLIAHPDLMSSQNVSVLRWASLVSACSLVFSVQLGVQTLPLLLSGELFPADVRASCKGLTRAITCIFLVLSVKMYPQLEGHLSLSGTFFSFSCVMILFFPVVYLILPETKDLSLEMIQQYFTS